VAAPAVPSRPAAFDQGDERDRDRARVDEGALTHFDARDHQRDGQDAEREPRCQRAQPGIDTRVLVEPPPGIRIEDET